MEKRYGTNNSHLQGIHPKWEPLHCEDFGWVYRPTEELKSGEEHSQLFLRFIHPHKPVVSSTISGWLKTILMKSGVGTGTFETHSTKSASTSKGGLQSVSIDDILKRNASLVKVPGKDFVIRILLKKGKYYRK